MVALLRYAGTTKLSREVLLVAISFLQCSFHGVFVMQAFSFFLTALYTANRKAQLAKLTLTSIIEVQNYEL